MNKVDVNDYIELRNIIIDFISKQGIENGIALLLIALGNMSISLVHIVPKEKAEEIFDDPVIHLTLKYIKQFYEKADEIFKNEGLRE